MVITFEKNMCLQNSLERAASQGELNEEDGGALASLMAASRQTGLACKRKDPMLAEVVASLVPVTSLASLAHSRCLERREPAAISIHSFLT